MYRICLAGAFVLLGACTTPPERPYTPPPMPVAATAEPVPSPVTVSPPAEALTAAPVAVATPVLEQPPTMPAASAPPAAPAAPASNAAPVVTPALPPQPVSARVAAAAPKPALTPKPAVKPTVKPMPVSAAESSKAAVDAPATPPTTRATLRGQVSLDGSRGQQVAAGDVADTLVYYVPAAGGGRVKPGNFTVYTHNRDFNPEAISVPQGSTVTFVNLDDVRHNVFSVTPGSNFNLGYQASGEKATHTFGRAGLVLVSCNVHRSMELDMLVVPTPYSAKVGADGSFTLQGLPAGSGKLYFWNPRAQLSSQSVTLPMSGAVTQKLVASKPHMDTQLNTGNRP